VTITPTSVVDITVPPLGQPNLHNVWQINFPTQTANGIYTLTIGPNITNLIGVQMDQNQNGIAGEIPGDRFTMKFVMNTSDDGLFVSGTFHDVLTRTSDFQGFINGLTPVDAARFALLPSFANRFLLSGEYFTDLVKGWYQKYLGRAADPGGLTGNVNALIAGMTDEQVIANLVASTEYFNKNGGTNALFVAAAFRDILGRTVPDPAGQAFFVNQLAAGVSRATVATELLGSNEYRSNLVASYYVSFLARTGSAAEIAAWVTNIANGMRDETVINFFVSSLEYFQNPSLGGDTNLTWLTSLYTNAKILNRAPDTAGLNFNLNALLNGYAAQRQAESAVLLSSNEYRTNLVKGWYQKYLGRAADAGGLAGNVALLAAGATDEQVIAGLVGSAEYFSKNGGTNSTFVAATFRDILGRTVPDPSGQAFFVNQLAAGVSRTTVAAELLGSTEYRNNLVGGFYTNLLGRTGSASEVAGWVAAIASGMTDEQVINTFLTTNEYFLRTTPPHQYP
jgi:hypothetical protein